METKEMNRKQFLNRIYDLFNKRELSENVKATYDLALTCPYGVDWYNFYKYVAENSETRILPMPKYFKDLLPKFKKIEYKEGVFDGCLIVISLLDGRKYCFEVSEQFGYNKISDIREKMKDSIEAIVKYPKGTVIMGDKIFYPEGQEGQCEILWRE